MKQNDANGEVSFGGGGHTAAVGILGGVAIAVGGPWVLLSQGQVLGATALLWLVVTAVALGSLVALTAAFFGLVMPSRVHGGWADPGHVRAFGREAQHWGHGRHGRRGRSQD